MIYVFIIGWLALGAVGYFLMRQGFLVDIGIWDKSTATMGILAAIIGGPIFIAVAFMVNGKSCLKNRKEN
ncbi:MAG: hypothetical protein ACYSSI_00325 [Planctomycetota bacterium]|jgi:hypothetical protein